VIKQLNDTSNDVQSVAVKCLAILVQKVHLQQVRDITTKLTAAILSGKDDLRDIYAIGLKTCISGLHSDMGANIASSLCSDLITGLKQEGNVKLECFDILSDLLKRFGIAVSNDHVAIS